MNPFDLTGPQFLLFYVIFAGLVLTGTVFWRRRAELTGSPRIDLSDPYLIAYLRGGEKEVLRVATIALIERGLLVRNGKQIQCASNVSPAAAQKPIEKALLKKYARAGVASSMFEDDGLSNACEPYGNTLRQARLLPDEWVTQNRWIRLAVAGSLLGGVALTKVLIAVAAGRTNVGFLLALTMIAIVVAAKFSFPRLTESGKAMIEDAQSLYSGMRTRAASVTAGSAGGAGVEPLMLAAVFGVGALTGPALLSADVFEEEHKKMASNSCSTSHSGCGSGGSSCSSGGGSSCGSSCGGGCGGCGGS
ncbi:MAG TPA: TIGR04222 domain-containing membrane protein [Pyrinomonadaceae bacterium]|nr:TIGR04222 domain-containing membrane protein [Pyrinomonadaceae bacterium]